MALRSRRKQELDRLADRVQDQIIERIERVQDEMLNDAFMELSNGMSTVECDYLAEKLGVQP